VGEPTSDPAPPRHSAGRHSRPRWRAGRSHGGGHAAPDWLRPGERRALGV